MVELRRRNAMKKYLTTSLVALGLAGGLAGCNAQAQADATAVAEYICTSAQTLQASGLALNAPQTTALNSVINACNATAGGSNLTQPTAVAALFAGLVTLQQGGLLSGVKMKALAPEQLTALQRSGQLPSATVDWIVEHDFR
jgi:hypothetical protein